jgi:hypothetical protein
MTVPVDVPGRSARSPSGDQVRPSNLLLGVLVDVSGSMTSSIQNAGGYQSRLESFRDALERMVQRAAEAVRERANQTGEVHARLFAYGFGFGNLLSELMGKKGPAVRNLLSLSSRGPRTIDITELADNWVLYRQHVESLTPEMFGSTPMGEAFSIAEQQLKEESQSNEAQVLLVVSDGQPDEAGEIIANLAQTLKSAGVLIVSCYVTDGDVTEPRRLYSRPGADWPDGARLMHRCASEVPVGSPVERYLREYKWTTEQGAHLFTQINQSELLSEFMNVVLSLVSPEFADTPAHIAVDKGSIPSDSPAIGPPSLYHREETQVHQPDSLHGALVHELLPRKGPLRRATLTIIGIALLTFAVWSSLPDATKDRVITALFAR